MNNLLEMRPADRTKAIIDFQSPKFRRAMQRAKERKPYVKVIDLSERLFSVTSEDSEHVYTLQLGQMGSAKVYECFDENGDDCNGYHYSGMCFHCAAAVAVNVGVRMMRNTTAATSKARVAA